MATRHICHVTHRSHNNTVWQIGLIFFFYFKIFTNLLTMSSTIWYSDSHKCVFCVHLLGLFTQSCIWMIWGLWTLSTHPNSCLTCQSSYSPMLPSSAAFLKLWGAPHWWGIETWQVGRAKREEIFLFMPYMVKWDQIFRNLDQDHALD